MRIYGVIGPFACVFLLFHRWLGPVGRGSGQMGLNLWRAKESEISEVVALVNSAYRGDTSRLGWTTEADLLDGQRTDFEEVRKLILDPESCLLLASLPGEASLVGCVLLKKKSRALAYLGMLTVRPALQAHGVGRLLLAGAEGWVCENWNSEKIEMTVISKRSELIAWYQRRGFQLTGETEAFPYGDERFGLPKTQDLEFWVLSKTF